MDTPDQENHIHITWASTPRQYRPTYSRLPPCTSEAASPFPATVMQTTVKSPSRRLSANSFPILAPLHSSPTVAKSGLTASASTGRLPGFSGQHQTLESMALAKSRSRQHVQTFTSAGLQESRNVTPTRIPSSIYRWGVQKADGFERAVSSPVVLWGSSAKENVSPKSHRLLGPIHPGGGTPNQNTTPRGLTKSRTMSVLSTLTSSFSKSSLTLSTSRSNLHDSYTNPNRVTSNPLPTFTTNVRQISTAQPPSYWVGRYVALHDRFRSEILTPTYLDSSKLRTWCQEAPDVPDDFPEDQPYPTLHDQTEYERDAEKLARRVFVHLEALCLTNEARKSLKAFQQAYARQVDCEALLPIGGCMVDKESVLVRAGRMLANRRKSSNGLVRKASVSVLGRK